MTLLLLATLLQDPGGLVRRLEDARPNVREKAQQALIEMGEAAVPALKKALASNPTGELRIRATAALDEIRDRAEVRRALPDARRLTFNAKDRPLSEVLDGIARDADVRIDRTRIVADAPVTVSAEKEPLLKVLDDLCAGSKNLSFQLREDGTIRFTRAPHVRRPTIYPGPFRIRMKSLEVARKLDYPDTRVNAGLELELDGEPGSAARYRQELKVTSATDDTGGKLRLVTDQERAMEQLVGGGRLVVLNGGTRATSGSGWMLTDLDPRARKISLKGEAHLFIPLAPRPVRFEDDPRKGRKVKVGDFEVELERVGPDCRFKVTRTSGEESDGEGIDLRSRIDPASVVAVDGEGNEHRPAAFGPTNEIESVMDLEVLVVGGPNGGKVVQRRRGGTAKAFSARFTALPGGLKELRFTFADRVYEKVIPFEITDIDLP